MKKYVFNVVLLCMLGVFSVSCGSGDAGQAVSAGNERSGSAVPAARVDVDLTSLSRTVLFAEINNMTANPDNYVGKMIKMRGPYYAAYFETTGRHYHHVLVEVADECCMQGLEFVWTGGHVYPDDYPEAFAVIEVIGMFDTYEEFGQRYSFLTVDNISVLLD